MKSETVPAVLESLNRVLALVDDFLDEVNCPMKTRMQIDVAVEEIFVNIAHYAYQPGNGDAEIKLWVEESPRSVMIEFRDNGKPFDPMAKPDPDVTLSADQREIGGLGIFMVKKSMDDVQYKRANGQNILRLRKNI